MLTADERALIQKAKSVQARERREAKALRPKKVMPTAQGQRQPRKHDNGYLAWLRRQPCVLREFSHGTMCGGPIDAAHIRTAKRRKPDDNRCVAMCRAHHTMQHEMNKMAFWARYGIDPFALAEKLYAQFKDGEDCEP